MGHAVAEVASHMSVIGADRKYRRPPGWMPPLYPREVDTIAEMCKRLVAPAR